MKISLLFGVLFLASLTQAMAAGTTVKVIRDDQVQEIFNLKDGMKYKILIDKKGNAKLIF